MAQTSEVRGARRRFRGDGGATLVEFAIMAPLMFLIIFAIIEFGWAFGQHLDVRHGARETSRLVAVNYGQDLALTGTAQDTAIVAEACTRMDLAGTITIDVVMVDGDGDGVLGEVGDFADVTVTHPLQTITGFLDFALAPGGTPIDLTSEVRTRLERGVGSTDQFVTFSDPISMACP